jgi:hypothetical protein
MGSSVRRRPPWLSRLSLLEGRLLTIFLLADPRYHLPDASPVVRQARHCNIRVEALPRVPLVPHL